MAAFHAGATCLDAQGMSDERTWALHQVVLLLLLMSVMSGAGVLQARAPEPAGRDRGVQAAGHGQHGRHRGTADAGDPRAHRPARHRPQALPGPHALHLPGGLQRGAAVAPPQHARQLSSLMQSAWSTRVWDKPNSRLVKCTWVCSCHAKQA